MGVKSQSSDKPLVVKRGSVIVKIYSGLTRGYKTFTLSYYEGGKRVRRTFASLAEAKSEAEIVATRLDNADARALELTGADREQYLLATNELEATGIPLHLAIREFVAARKISGGVSLVDTARLHQSRTDPNRPKKSVMEVTRECLAGKAADGLSHRYLVQLRSDLNRFSHDFEKQISDVEGSEIDDCLRGLRHDGKPVSGRTRNNLRTSITTLFSYARQRGYLPPDVSTAAESVPRAKVDESDIEILTPGQMEKLLRNAEGDALLHIVLGGFAGLRTAEISRLTWDNIDLARGAHRCTSCKSQNRVPTAHPNPS